MKEIFDKLEKWRVDRNLNSVEFDLNVYTANILEEIAEYLRAKDDYERVDALCDICVFSINALDSEYSKYEYKMGLGCITDLSYLDNVMDYLSTINKVNKKCSDECIIEIIESSICEIESMNYNFEKCMLETIKEISSRRQDPQQASDWLVNGISGKWQKDKNQDPQTLYKADYERCKR
jgi:hypothetical protein